MYYIKYWRLKKIDNTELTATLPNSNVHNNRLPFFRTEYTYSASLSPNFIFLSNSSFYKDINPNVKPEKSPDKITSDITIVIPIVSFLVCL